MLNFRAPLTLGQCATLACLCEVSAPKPGNVHRGADFADATFYDFAASAVAIGPAMEAAARCGVGGAVLAAITATRRLVSTNTNLGTVLLLAPLACVPREQDLAAGVPAVLGSLTPRDSHLVYEAIRLAQPGGLGSAAEMDVAGEPPPDLLAAMRWAAPRDIVARQYATNFADLFSLAVPVLAKEIENCGSLMSAIVRAQLRLLAEIPDTLMARKGGDNLAQQASAGARQVLAAGGIADSAYLTALADFDFWLRSDGNRRNPGATADLLAAALFVLARDDKLPLPLPW